MSVWGNVADFTGGFASGAWEGAKSAVTGVVDLAKGGYRIATDPEAAEQAWETGKQIAQNAQDYGAAAAEDKWKPLRDARDGVSSMRTRFDEARRQAAARGESAEFWGETFGRGTFEVGGMFVPVGAASKAGYLGKGAKAAKALDKASDATDLARTGARARAAGVGKALPDMPICTQGCPRAASASSRTRSKTRATSAITVRRFDNAIDFNRAANASHPNTRYEFGNYSYTTDAHGRVSATEGVVDLTPAGRNAPKLQAAIGRQGRDTDVGFHLIGDRFGGQTNRLNVVPGNGKPIGDGAPNLNQGAFKRFENQIAELASDPNKRVEVRILSKYADGNASSRPDEFVAQYRVNGGLWRKQTFKNK